MAIAMTTARIAITTISSISVKPACCLCGFSPVELRLSAGWKKPALVRAGWVAVWIGLQALRPARYVGLNPRRPGRMLFNFPAVDIFIDIFTTLHAVGTIGDYVIVAVCAG